MRDRQPPVAPWVWVLWAAGWVSMAPCRQQLQHSGTVPRPQVPPSGGD